MNGNQKNHKAHKEIYYLLCELSDYLRFFVFKLKS